MPQAPQIAVLDYGMGNLRSVANAMRHVGADVRLATRPAELEGAHGLVFPGQGAIVDCMVRLRETGFDDAIREWIEADRPFFGVCLGLQALFTHSEEGDTAGIGVFDGVVRRFRLSGEWKIPHMGWNAVRFREQDGVGEDSLNGASFYFVHSYCAVPADEDLIWGLADYGGWFCAAIRRGNCLATQFHPEKSQSAGLQLYRNFLKLTESHVNA